VIRELFQFAAAPALPYTPALLAFADRTQLTLQLRSRSDLPPWFAAEIETRHDRNAIRRGQLHKAYAEIAALLTAQQVDFVLLKGFTHETTFGIDPTARIQYDLDFLIEPAALARAQSAIETLGYVPHGDHSLSDEHSIPLVRPNNWRWRGDYFDTEIPVQIELHDSLWSPTKDRIAPPGLENFWDRRLMIDVNGLSIPALSEPDRVAFASLHALRHILRNDARPAHVHELARFLETRAHDEAFWTEWRTLYDPQLKSLQTIAFRFAHEWFACPWPEAVAEVWSQQPHSVTTRFKEFAWSPAENILRPHKDIVWLHLALTKTFRDRASIFCDRLLPLRLPHRQEPERYSASPLSRLRYHAAAFAPALASGVRWWWKRDTASTASHTSDWKRRSV
jgi:hypothetical protein